MTTKNPWVVGARVKHEDEHIGSCEGTIEELRGDHHIVVEWDNPEYPVSTFMHRSHVELVKGKR